MITKCAKRRNKIEQEDHSAKPSNGFELGQVATLNSLLEIEHQQLLIKSAFKTIRSARLLNTLPRPHLPEHFEEAEITACLFQLLPHLHDQQSGQRLYNDSVIGVLVENEVKKHDAGSLSQLSYVRYPEITRIPKDGNIVGKVNLEHMKTELRAFHDTQNVAKVPSFRKILETKGIDPERLDDFVNFPESKKKREPLVEAITRFYQLLQIGKTTGKF